MQSTQIYRSDGSRRAEKENVDWPIAIGNKSLYFTVARRSRLGSVLKNLESCINKYNVSPFRLAAICRLFEQIEDWCTETFFIVTRVLSNAPFDFLHSSSKVTKLNNIF